MTALADRIAAQVHDRIPEPRGSRPCDHPTPPARGRWRPCQYPERPLDGSASIGSGCRRCLIAYAALLQSDPGRTWALTGAEGRTLHVDGVTAATQTLKSAGLPADDPLVILIRRALEDSAP